MSALRGIRGATTVGEDTPTAIVAATSELLTGLIAANAIEPEQIAGVWFTTTPDLRSEFPAVAARRLGWVDVPLLCGQEMNAPAGNPRSIPRCVRVMILLNTELRQQDMRFLYMRGATAIREELDLARAGQLPEPADTAAAPGAPL
ncbi:MAG TPA: chorismate mutase [Candidatus Dormibacteraeota bacterium]